MLHTIFAHFFSSYRHFFIKNVLILNRFFSCCSTATILRIHNVFALNNTFFSTLVHCICRFFATAAAAAVFIFVGKTWFFSNEFSMIKPIILLKIHSIQHLLSFEFSGIVPYIFVNFKVSDRINFNQIILKIEFQIYTDVNYFLLSMSICQNVLVNRTGWKKYIYI